MWARHPDWLPARVRAVTAAGHAADPQPAPPGPGCVATVRLRELPSPHEVLLHLGATPLRTRALPVGVRLELVVTAPGYRPARLVVPSDAAWVEAGSSRTLPLAVTLTSAPASDWPAAPEGEVGGVGPMGHIELGSTPAGADAWLVAGAGDDPSRDVLVPCDEQARLLVVSPRQPLHRKPVTIEAALLRAAAQSGVAADVFVR